MPAQKITKKLIQDLVEASHRLAGYELILGAYHDLPTVRVPAATEPASADSLRDLASHLKKDGLPFPPSYRTFLGLTDGIENFVDDVSLLGARQVTKPACGSHQRVFPTLSKFQIGRSADTLEFVAFDVSGGADRDEPEVVWIADNGEESRDESFTAFLYNRLDTLTTRIEQSKARVAKKSARGR